MSETKKTEKYDVLKGLNNAKGDRFEPGTEATASQLGDAKQIAWFVEDGAIAPVGEKQIPPAPTTVGAYLDQTADLIVAQAPTLEADFLVEAEDFENSKDGKGRKTVLAALTEALEAITNPDNDDQEA